MILDIFGKYPQLNARNAHLIPNLTLIKEIVLDSHQYTSTEAKIDYWQLTKLQSKITKIF